MSGQGQGGEQKRTRTQPWQQLGLAQAIKLDMKSYELCLRALGCGPTSIDSMPADLSCHWRIQHI